MTDPFARLTTSVLTRLGKDASLRGNPCKAHAEYNVQFIDRHGNPTVGKVVLTIDKLLTPESGDMLRFVDGPSFKLDAFVDDNGYSLRFVGLPIVYTTTQKDQSLAWDVAA